MALTPLEILRTGKVMNAFVKRKRPPDHLRDQQNLLWTLEGQSVYLLDMQRQPGGEWHEHRFAKATWVRTQKIWRIYWQRADQQWHRYEPEPTVKAIQGFCDAVDADPYGCFWG